MADLVESNVRINLINPNELLRGMARHPELCIIITFLITFVIKYGTSFKAKPVTLPPKPPQYMFSPTTFVLDSPRGSLIPLTEVLHSKEFVFVMYYAPWCYKPKAARAEFLKAANYFKGQVPFAAVNCWWLEGECRKRYKFLMFPVFMAYNTRLDGYRYFGKSFGVPPVASSGATDLGTQCLLMDQLLWALAALWCTFRSSLFDVRTLSPPYCEGKVLFYCSEFYVLTGAKPD
ncbi:Thioredoxin domain-containing protein 11 [Bulinus truncatus]|nr:Thioredoxin domain-containing protein 11 [Bulinus truncatus]